MNGSRRPNAVHLLLLELSNHQDIITRALSQARWVALLRRYSGDMTLNCVTLHFAFDLDRQTVCKRQRYTP